jgi:methyl acetate hydrolase
MSPGFVYSHAESFLSKWVQQKAIPSIFDPKASIESLCTPLMYEPGTSWAYSHSIDWVGILVERISGLSLEDYFRKHIFEPCAINSMTFYPTEAIKAHKMAVCTRDADGKVQVIPGGYGMGRPTDPAQVSLLLGGAGLFGTQKDYLSLLRMILQCDPNSPHRSDKPLISGKSFNELFKPSILSDAGCERLSEMVTRPDYITPKPTPQTINHSIAFLLTQADLTARRKANSGCWSGAAKTQFWIDPTTGIAVRVPFKRDILSPGYASSNADWALRLFAALSYLVRHPTRGFPSMSLSRSSCMPACSS